MSDRETRTEPEAVMAGGRPTALLAGLVAGVIAGTAAMAETARPDAAPGRTGPPPSARQETETMTATDHPYVGLWVTGDGHVRQELRPDGRYDEARGSRRSAYQGRYAVRGTRIDYWDDTGFTADGTFVGPDELHHGGMVFHRAR